jgi:hypothetical protein
LGPLPPPSLSVAPQALSFRIPAGESLRTYLDLRNEGTGELVWSAAASTPPTDGLPEGTPKGMSPPGSYGYYWIDSLQPGGPVYEWVEPGPTALHLCACDDANIGPLSLGFRFPFYGCEYDQLHICSNGWLSFTSSATTATGTTIPDPTEPNALIAPYWTDLNPYAGGEITAWYDASGPRYVVTWTQVPHYPATAPETFQVVLEADGSILCQYQVVADNTDHTIGIEHADGRQGLLVLRNAPYLQDGMAILIERDPTAESWLSAEPVSGRLWPGASERITVDLDAALLSPGTYTGSITLTSNDPQWGVLQLPVELVVLNGTGITPPDVTRTRLTTVSPNPFNPRTSISLDVAASGDRVEVGVYDALGRRVRNVFTGALPGGGHTIVWNGLDDRGRPAPSGTYLLRLRAGHGDGACKIQLLR